MPTSKPLRQWIEELDGAARSWSTRASAGTSRPNRAEAVCAPTRPSWREAGLSAHSVRGARARLRPGSRRSRRAPRGDRRPSSRQVAELSEPGLHRALGRAHADGDLVYTASSMPIRDQEAFVAAGDADVLFLCNRGANGIDGLISSGIGAAHASGRPTTIVTGDLGLLHDIGGLAALRDVSTPVRIVVIDNGGGGIFHFLPQEEALASDEFEALLGTPRGLDVAAAAKLFRHPAPAPRGSERSRLGPGRRHRADRSPCRPPREP